VGVEIIETAEAQSLARFDMVIDVRSPAEFAEDHVPGAVNLPVLSNLERAEVGTIYVQESRFRARRIGAAMIARNVARYLEDELADRDGAFQPLIYCWRGGQRSNAMATILSQVGWRTAVLKGGYKTYRGHVSKRLYDMEFPNRVVLLEGPTGVGKTELLSLLSQRGVQTLDLEGLAAHRGSLFGGIPGVPQPSQKMFESRLLSAVESLDPARPVVVESESSKVGERMVPPALWKLMETAPRISVTAPAEARARYIVSIYSEITRDPAALEDILARVPDRPGRKRLGEWREMAAAGDFEALALALIELHYDPSYRRAGKRDARPVIASFELADVTPASLVRAADAIAQSMIDAGARLPAQAVRA
jgi:tRNA 2-selenouridine synthase